LRQEVEKGPVVAIVKLHMATSGENHALVVTGISPDGSQVRVNDPWTGESRVYAKEQFTQSWGSNFGSGVPINNFVVIRPS
jgi:predicted double-glycine peptidase